MESAHTEFAAALEDLREAAARVACADPRAREATAGARFHTWWRGVDLDLLLGAGVDPLSTDALCVRAAQVTDRSTLNRHASALDAAVEAVEMSRVAAAHVI